MLCGRGRGGGGRAHSSSVLMLRASAHARARISSARWAVCRRGLRWGDGGWGEVGRTGVVVGARTSAIRPSSERRCSIVYGEPAAAMAFVARNFVSSSNKLMDVRSTS